MTLPRSDDGRIALTLGPVLFNWPTDRWADFYRRIADEAPVERVCVGETVCSKRMPFRESVMADVLERLERGGKEVVLAALALPTLPREIRTIRDMAAADYLVEANDMTAVHILAGQPHVIGPLLNIYNEDAVRAHVGLGATRICLSPELPLDQCCSLAVGSRAIEVFAFGRAPLSLSARCHHARAYGLTKDSCQFVCERDLDGLAVNTMDDQPFIAVNGIQTLAFGITAALNHVGALKAAGVVSLRLSPLSCDMVRVAETFRNLADDQIDAAGAEAALERLAMPGPLVDGYLRGLPGARALAETD